MKTMKKIFTVMILLIGLITLSACQSGITISFETNGGNEIADIKLSLDLDLNNLEEPTKTGYNFAGWYTDSDLTTAFDPEVTITDNITLYAKWNPIVFTVSVSIDGVLTTQSVNYGEDALLPTAPTKEGYTFTGWSSDGKNITSDIMITASFLINEYTITFVVGEEELYTRNVNHGGTLANDLIPVVPDVTGKNGVWNTTDFTNITSDITVTAIYTDKVYTVTYVNKSGDTILGNASYGPFEISHGTVMTAPNASDSITGYDFIGYDYDFEEAVTSDLTIVANYTKQSFTVTFKGLNGAVLKTQTVLYGNDATAPDYTAPEGYTLGGWNTAFTNVTSNLTVQMNLNPVNYDIVFITGEGSQVPTITAPYLSAISAPANPTLTDMDFQGWYLDEAGTTPFIFTEETKMPLNGLTLYAIFDYLRSYQVTVNRFLTKSTGTTQQTPTIYQVDYLEEFAPYLVIDGYDFVKYTIDGVDYTNPAGLLTIESTVSVDVYYQIKTYTITFTQNPTGSLKIDQDFTVEYNSTFTEIPLLQSHYLGYDAMWDREVFTNIQQDIIVGALYFSSTLKRVVFMDGTTIKYIAVQEASEDSDIISNTSALMNLTKPGYVFLGWYDSPEFTNLINFAEFKYQSFTEISATLYAKWEALDTLETPVIDDVAGNTITWHVSGVNGLYPATFKLLLDGVETVITPLTAVQSGSITTYTYETPALTIAGTHTIKLMSLGIQGESISSEYSLTFTHITEAAPVEVVDEVLIYDYFLIEKAQEVSTYIFYTGMVYNFDAKFTFTITEGGQLVSANGNKMTTNDLTGTFSFEVYNSTTQVTKPYQGKVVTYINQFALGSSLTNYINATDSGNELFLSNTVTPYLVGDKNDFYFDLRILDSKGVRINPEDTLLTYKFLIWNGTAYQELTTDKGLYLSMNSQYKINFTNEAVGKRFKVEIDPKYEALKVQSPTLTFEFEVNDGYNVFTDAELKTLFADFNVHNINLHSTIYPTLAPEQLNEDGTPVNGYATPIKLGANNGKIYANPYIRMSGSIDNDNLVINGNYFTVNGSDLPHMTVNSDPDGGYRDTGFDGSFDVVSVQVSIFYYNVYASLSTNNNNISFNNLTLIGNTATPYINYSQSAEEILLAEQLMSRNSGGYVGITIRNGNSHIYNTNIGLMTIGLTTNAYGLTSESQLVGAHLDYCTFYNEWANSIFGWASSLIEVKNTEIGLSGGAAIHVEDNIPASGGPDDPTVILDDSTTVNNWVSGQEAWFKAYGMTGTALVIKGMADQGIAPLNKTIVREIENPVTGLKTEMFNFVLLTKTLGSASTDTTVPADGVNDTGSEFQLNIPKADGTLSLIHQPFNFLTMLPIEYRDPRIQNGNYAFAVHDLNDTMNFYTAMTTLMSAPYGLSQGDAVNVIYVAAFHNVDLYTAMQLGGMTSPSIGLTWQQAYQTLMIPGQAPDEGRYMEISAQVEGLGPVIMITEYYARTPE